MVGTFTVTTQIHKRLSYNSQRANHLKWGLRERVQSSDEAVPRMFRIPLSIKLFIFK